MPGGDRLDPDITETWRVSANSIILLAGLAQIGIGLFTAYYIYRNR